ncbi:MAG: hypothetical protein ACTJGH_00285 [Peptoniphilaceae bacterium]
MQIESPCLDCRYRSINCHDRCLAYFKYKKRLDKYNETKKKIDSFSINTIKMLKKSNNRRFS